MPEYELCDFVMRLQEIAIGGLTTEIDFEDDSTQTPTQKTQQGDASQQRAGHPSDSDSGRASSVCSKRGALLGCRITATSSSKVRPLKHRIPSRPKLMSKFSVRQAENAVQLLTSPDERPELVQSTCYSR